jgi:hypothetical protein
MRIKIGTVDPAQLLVPVFLRKPDGTRYVGTLPSAVIGATVTFTPPAGGIAVARVIISRGNGRYEMQLLAGDVIAGNGWVDVIAPAYEWLDFSDSIEFYAS